MESPNNPQNTVDQMFQKIEAETNAAINKYSSLVKSLSDLDFAGLYIVVMRERQARMVRIMLENPAIMRQAIEDVNRAFKDEGN